MLFQPLIYALIFVGVFMMVEGVYLVIYGKTLKREKKVNRRLALLQDGKDTEEVMGILRQEREGAEKHERMPGLGPLVEMARHAAITLSIPQIVISMIVLAIVSFLLMTLFTGAVIQIRIVVAIITGYAAFYIWLRGKAKKRISLFEEQLPDALDLMVRSLRVGHPMNAAVGIVAREMMDPLGTEFGLIADEATYGMPITDALDRMSSRVPVPDLRFLAIAINIQSTSGGKEQSPPKLAGRGGSCLCFRLSRCCWCKSFSQITMIGSRIIRCSYPAQSSLSSCWS
jgi:tight adherence protein B